MGANHDRNGTSAKGEHALFATPGGVECTKEKLCFPARSKDAECETHSNGHILRNSLMARNTLSPLK